MSGLFEAQAQSPQTADESDVPHWFNWPPQDDGSGDDNSSGGWSEEPEVELQVAAASVVETAIKREKQPLRHARLFQVTW